MSYAPIILAQLADRGVTLQLDGDALVPRGPRNSLTAERLDALRRHKPEIVAFLRSRSRPSADSVPPSGTDDEKEDTLAQRVADLADAYAERIAIVMEAGDIGESEAEATAAVEVGREFVRLFLPSGSAPEQGRQR